MGKKKRAKKIQTTVERPTSIKFRLSQIDLLAIVGLLVMTFIYFFKAATRQGIFITGDLTLSDLMSQYYPFRHFLSESLKGMNLPLWTSYIFGGYPILAQGEIGAFYPLNLILFSLLAPDVAFNYSVILNFFLGALFLFLYARVLNLKSISSLLASIAFSFSGFFIMQIRHINMINTAIWIPLLFLLIELYFKGKKIVYIILAGLVFGIQVLAGHFQIAYYSVLGTSLYFLFKLGQDYFQGIKLKRKTPFSIDMLKSLPMNLWIVLLIFVIGGGLSALQILPTYEFTQQGTRSQGMSFEEAVSWPYPPSHLITYIFPYFYGDYADATYHAEGTLAWENCGYVGIITLILAIASLVLLKSNGYVRFYSIFCVLSLCLAMGKYTPLFKLFWTYVPGANYFRFPNRFLLFSALSLSILAGFGMNYILNKIKDKRLGAKLALLLLTLTILDLFTFGRWQNPTVSPKDWFAKPQTAKFLSQDKTLFRMCSFGTNESWRMVYSKSAGWKNKDLSLYIKHREVLEENFNMIYHIPSFFGYPPKSFGLQRFSDIYYYLLYQTLKLYGRPNEPLPFTNPDPAFSKILGIMNVKYILSLWAINDPNLEVVMKTDFKGEIPDVAVYKNKQFLPRVYVVPKAKQITEGEIIKELGREGFNPYEYVLLEEKIPQGILAEGSDMVEGSVAKILEYSHKKVVIQADLTAPGFLILGDTYYPGWKVFVDGKEDKIYRANYIQRAVFLKQGKHKIRFIYDPLSFKIGVLISIITLLSIVIYIIYHFKQEGNYNVISRPSI